MRSLRSAAGSQLHQQARRKTSLLRVPGGQEAAGLPAAAGARGGSRAVVARAAGKERNSCWPGLRRTGEEAPWRGRTPRISRLMAVTFPQFGNLKQPIDEEGFFASILTSVTCFPK